MTKFIKLTNDTGNSITINVNQILTIQPSTGRGSYLMLVGRDYGLWVTEDYDKLVQDIQDTCNQSQYVKML